MFRIGTESWGDEPTGSGKDSCNYNFSVHTGSVYCFIEGESIRSSYGQDAIAQLFSLGLTIEQIAVALSLSVQEVKQAIAKR